jgi:hypothetical protein
MHAQYIPLPFANAQALSSVVSAAAARAGQIRRAPREAPTIARSQASQAGSPQAQGRPAGEGGGSAPLAQGLAPAQAMTAAPASQSLAGIDTTSWITLQWTRGTRYYRVHLEQDLWAGWLITQVHGRRGSPLGRARFKPAPSIEAALLELSHIANRRQLRGYELTR